MLQTSTKSVRRNICSGSLHFADLLSRRYCRLYVIKRLNLVRTVKQRTDIAASILHMYYTAVYTELS